MAFINSGGDYCAAFGKVAHMKFGNKTRGRLGAPTRTCVSSRAGTQVEYPEFKWGEYCALYTLQSKRRQ